MKKLPYPLYLALFLGVLGIIAAGLLAGINILTAPAIKANEKKKLAEQLKVIEVESPTEKHALFSTCKTRTNS